ncbi:MAG TPA: response regulator [Terriglobia bacterium]|jgi:DNA-binding response OmpR family regulator|nr:response regulator [Terriglobia bacterium]
MKVLIADDDPVCRAMVEAALHKWNYQTVVASDGAEAWKVLQEENPPPVAILDWVMPRIDGPELCRRTRARSNGLPVYIILLTARGSQEDLVAGLEAGADDYITKPFRREELRARLNVGMRVIQLQRSLSAHVKELQSALASVKQLQGLLPICMYCKNVRNDSNYWERVESYIAEHSDVRFSHGICPDCYIKIMKPQLDKLGAKIV